MTSRWCELAELITRHSTWLSNTSLKVTDKSVHHRDDGLNCLCSRDADRKEGSQTFWAHPYSVTFHSTRISRSDFGSRGRIVGKKKLYIYTHSSWTEFHLASNLELWRWPWLRYSGFVMWSWTCSVSMVVHSIKFTVKLCQDFFVLISTQHSIHKYTKTKKALCFLSFYLSPLGYLVGWSLMNLED